MLAMEIIAEFVKIFVLDVIVKSLRSASTSVYMSLKLLATIQ